MCEKDHCGDGEVNYKPVKEGLTTIIELREGVLPMLMATVRVECGKSDVTGFESSVYWHRGIRDAKYWTSSSCNLTIGVVCSSV